MRFVSRLTDRYPLMIRAVVLLLAVVFYSGSASVYAQEESSGGSRKTVKAPAMSEKVYKKLTAAQELIEAKKYQEGLAQLRELEQQTGLSNYEKAQLYNYFAYTYFTMEKYKDAINNYEKVLAQPDLPEALVQNSLYTLAQLYFILEDYKKAVDTIKRWFAVTDKPTENAYMLLGQGYYQLEKYKEALEPLKTAYKLVRDRGDKPKENLLLLMRVVYFNLNDFKNMVEVLHELIELYPKDEYWLTMAGAYSELKQYKKQMSILEMLYEKGSLERGNQQLNLANLFLLYDVPYKAAKLMDKAVKEGKIEKTERNLQLLSQAWLQAQEPDKSITPLEQATKIAKDGDINLRLAQAYINLDRYEDAVGALRTGMKKGGIKRPDQANIMLGMALFELQKFEAAKNAFKEATEDKRSRKSAEQWLSYVASEQSRKQQLEESLQRRRN